MGSKELSERNPDWVAKASEKSISWEKSFADTCQDYLDKTYPNEFEVYNKKYIHIREKSKVPDTTIKYLKNDKMYFIEVKSQGPQGNAHERAVTWHPCVGVCKAIREKFGYDYNPASICLTESLITEARYKKDFDLYWYGYEYLVIYWKGDYDSIAHYLESVILPRLRGEITDG